tara:strand:+ start:10670 stop:10996 length:327 start_codon:yes stop_codon:yes gene_type:complete
MGNNSVTMGTLGSGAPLHPRPDDSCIALRSLNAGQANPNFSAFGDPAIVVATAVRCGVMGRVSRQGIPEVVRNGLRHHASQDEPACQLVLDWLDGLMLSDIEKAERGS